MGKALGIKDALSADALRRELLREKDGRAAARMHAIAHALDGLGRAEAARLAGMERQGLRDAVVRDSAEGLAGLRDRPRGRPRRRLGHGEEAALTAAILRGPDPDVDGCCARTRADLCRWLEAAYGKTCQPSRLSRVLRRLGVSRQKARPFHPEKDPEAREAFENGGLGERIAAVAAQHPGKRIALWLADEAPVGTRGRVCHRWWRRGERPPGLQQIGHLWAALLHRSREGFIS